MFGLFSNVTFTQNNWDLDYQSANFAFLVVDFNTLSFEGGYFTKFPYQSGYDTTVIPLNVVYNPPFDYGNITFTYLATNDTVFAGDIWWAGQGHITFPDTIDNSSQFTYDSIMVISPFYISYFNYGNALEDSLFRQKADSAWMSIKKLSILKVFAEQGNVFRVGVYLYAPAVGVFNPDVAKWIVFLYRGQVIVGIENAIKIPKRYQLYQNYPNPFNPTTTINYSISKYSFITIKVYDVLGREVATLVNEYKPIGSYSVKFNAFNLVSGIYFYRMQVENFTKTKKLILIK